MGKKKVWENSLCPFVVRMRLGTNPSLISLKVFRRQSLTGLQVDIPWVCISSRLREQNSPSASRSSSVRRTKFPFGYYSLSGTIRSSRTFSNIYTRSVIFVQVSFRAFCPRNGETVIDRNSSWPPTISCDWIVGSSFWEDAFCRFYLCPLYTLAQFEAK